jgi:hypothetical protein
MFTGKKSFIIKKIVVVVVKKVIIKNLCVELQNYYKQSADSTFIQKAGPKTPAYYKLWSYDN